MYQGITYRKGEVNELPDPAVHNPPGVEQLVTRPVVEQLVRGRHYSRSGLCGLPGLRL